jgi:hypothetical protein
VSWRDFELAAPEVAQAAKSRFEATRIALLGTLRADGSPRISPVEPFFTSDHLLFRAMTRSHKARDLERDPRCVLHSAISEPEAGEREFKLYGTAVVCDEDERDAPSDAWWASHPAEAARVFSLEIEEARGLEERTRAYP